MTAQAKHTRTEARSVRLLAIRAAISAICMCRHSCMQQERSAAAARCARMPLRQNHNIIHGLHRVQKALVTEEGDRGGRLSSFVGRGGRSGTDWEKHRKILYKARRPARVESRDSRVESRDSRPERASLTLNPSDDESVTLSGDLWS